MKTPDTEWEKECGHKWTYYDSEECDICGHHIGVKCELCGEIKTTDANNKAHDAGVQDT